MRKQVEVGYRRRKRGMSSERRRMGWREEVWGSFKRLLESPRLRRPTGDWIPGGLLWYGGCFLGAWVLIAVALQKDTAVVVSDYRESVGDYARSIPHMMPDCFMCPARRKGKNFEFAVFYTEGLMEKIGMSWEEAEELVRQYYQGCDENGCKDLIGNCSGRFAIYCDRVQVLLQEAKTGDFKYHFKNPQYYGQPSPVRHPGYPYVANVTKDFFPTWHGVVLDREITANHGMNLNLLLRSILDIGYWANTATVKKYLNVSLAIASGHFYDANGEVLYLNDLFDRSQQEVWVGKALCSMVHGHELGIIESPYVGIDRHWPGFVYNGSFYQGPWRYWFGNLNNEQVSESALIHANHYCDVGECIGRFGSILHYSSIAFKSPEGTELDCLDQPHMRGRKPECDETAWMETHTAWYYDFNLVSQPPIHALWVYPNQLTEITLKRVHTPYTMYQFLAGILGACVGFSILQPIEFLLSVIGKVRRARKFVAFLRLFFLLVIALTTVLLTSMDLKRYVANRYVKQFQRRTETTLPNPVINFCGSAIRPVPFAFFDLELLHKYQISLELYAFITKFARQKYPFVRTPIFPIVLEGTNKTIYSYYNFSLQNFNLDHFVYNDVTMFRHNSSYKCWSKFCPWDAFFLSYPLRDVIWDEFAHDNGSLYDTNCFPAPYFSHQPPPEDWFVPLLLGPNFDQQHFASFQASIADELADLGRKVGLAKDAPLLRYAKALSIIPKIISIPQCEEQKSCRLTSHFNYGNKGMDTCDEIHIESNSTLINNIGYDSGIDIIVDGPAFLKMSDYSAYLGPGTLEEQIKLTNTQPFLFAPPQEFQKKLSYMPSVDFNDGDKFYLDISHPNGRGVALHYHLNFVRGGDNNAVNFKLSSQSLLTETNNCTKPGEELALAHEQVFASVVMAVQSVIFCNCSDSNQDTEEVRSGVDFVMGHEIGLCTATNALDCYHRHAENVRKLPDDQGYDLGSESGLALKTFVWKMALKLLQLDVKKIPGWTLKEVNELFINPHMLSSNAKQRFLVFMKDLYKPRCKEHRLVPGTVQNFPATDGKSRLRIYYDSYTADGIVEQDILNLVDFLGILSCTYSVTFGVGLIGLAEVLWSGCLNYKTSGQKMSWSGIRKHVLKSLLQTLAEEKASEDQAANAVVPMNEQEAAPDIEMGELGDRSRNSGLSTSKRNSTSSGSASSDRSMPNGDELPGPSYSKVETKAVSAQLDQISEDPGPSTSKATNFINSRPRIADPNACQTLQPDPTARVETNKEGVSIASGESNQNQDRSQNQAEDASNEPDQKRSDHPLLAPGMILALAISGLCCGGMLATFVAKYTPHTNKISIEKHPLYPLPAMGLCSKNATAPNDVKRILMRSMCTQRDEEYSSNCAHHFDLIYSTPTALCAVYESFGSRHVLNVSEVDMLVEVPIAEELFLWISGTNQSAAVGQEGSFRWTHPVDIILSYVPSLNWDQTDNCDPLPVPGGECQICSDHVLNPDEHCCLRRRSSPGRFRKPCFAYSYLVSLAFGQHKPEASRKTLTLKSNSEVVTAFITYYTLSPLELATVIGGFVGITLELTVLHALVLLAAILSALFKPVLHFFRLE